MSKIAATDHPIHEAVANRWSPYAFADRPVADEDIRSLVEANQSWARQAPVLVLTVVAENFARNGKPNLCAQHDVGLAAGNLSAEATARGLHVHQMGGILPDRARELFGIPEGFRALTAIAIGYADDPADLDDEFRKRETAPRSRRPLAETVFTGDWRRPADLLE